MIINKNSLFKRFYCSFQDKGWILILSKRRFQYPKVNGEEIEREESFVGLGNGSHQFIYSKPGNLNKIRISVSHYSFLHDFTKILVTLFRALQATLLVNDTGKYDLYYWESQGAINTNCLRIGGVNVAGSTAACRFESSESTNIDHLVLVRNARWAPGRIFLSLFCPRPVKLYFYVCLVVY